MIISRTPFRVSFTGGGSDLKDYYKKNKYGAVVSAAIQKYMYVIIHPYFQKKIRLKYSITEDVNNIEEIKHPIIKECLRKVNINTGIEIASIADIPSGTGLGSSSAFTVGLLNALYCYTNVVKSKRELAEEACNIEINILKEPIGKQDQYASAYGGLNYIKFNDDDSVDVSPIKIAENNIKAFENYFKLYYSGKSRAAKSILIEQKEKTNNNVVIDKITKMVRITDKLKKLIQNADLSLIADMVNENWKLKKSITNKISTSEIESLYSNAMKYGAKGAKLLGAGGSGFLFVIANDFSEIDKHLKNEKIDFRLDLDGTKILYNK